MGLAAIGTFALVFTALGIIFREETHEWLMWVASIFWFILGIYVNMTYTWFGAYQWIFLLIFGAISMVCVFTAVQGNKNRHEKEEYDAEEKERDRLELANQRREENNKQRREQLAAIRRERMEMARENKYINRGR